MNIHEILRDFRTKYQGTFAYTENPETGKEMLCRIDSIEDSAERNAVLSLQTREVGKLQLNLASSQRLFFRFPPIGTFQYGKDSMVIRRIAPHRNYVRGLFSSNHSINKAMCHIVPESRVRFDLGTVDAAFKAQKFSPEEAMKLLLAGKVRSAALKGQWTLTQPFIKDAAYGLLYGFDYVGQVDEKLNFTAARGVEDIVPEVAQLLLGL